MRHEKKRTRAVAGALAFIMLVALPGPSFAHHAIASTYDQNKTVQVKGTVTQFSWKSPHSELLMNVTDGPYKGRTYAVELDGPVAMMRQGWTSRQFNFGDEVVISVHPAKSGAAYGECLTCTVIINGRETKPKQ